MKLLLRRNFLKLAGALIATPALPKLASALDYPTRPTRIVAGFAAGGGVDITARLIGQWLADHLGQPFVVENRTGAGGKAGDDPRRPRRIVQRESEARHGGGCDRAAGER